MMLDNKKRNKLLLVLFIGVLMGALDIAIVGPALPAIQKQFGIDERTLSWIFSTYVLFNLIGTPLMAKLADLYGRRTLYILDTALFAIGSLTVAFSPSFFVLLAGRAVQGFGAGGIFPVASAVIGDTFPEDKRGGALGLIGAVFGIAFIIGPVLAGVLLLLSWHWLFLINIPVALLVIIMSIRLLPDTKNAIAKKFDWSGLLILTGIIVSLSIGFNRINSADFINSLLSVNVLPFFVAGFILLPFYKSSEVRAEDPILRLKLLSSRQVAIVCILALGAGISEAAVVFVPPLLVATFHVTNSKASFMLFPVVLAMAIGAPLAGRMLDKGGSRIVLMSGTLLLCAGMLGLSFKSGTLLYFYISAILIGIGMGGLVGAPLRFIMLNESQRSERASAQGVIRLFTGIGQLFGAALVGAVASSHGGGSGGLRTAYLLVGIMAAGLFIASGCLKSRARELAVETQ